MANGDRYAVFNQQTRSSRRSNADYITLAFQGTDGAVQSKRGTNSWTCPVCEDTHDIPTFTAFLSVVKCCGRRWDLQNWNNPYDKEPK